MGSGSVPARGQWAISSKAFRIRCKHRRHVHQAARIAKDQRCAKFLTIIGSLVGPCRNAYPFVLKIWDLRYGPTS